MTEETEIWGELDQLNFQTKLKVFEQRYGRPIIQKRLSLQADNFKRHDMDTRIRITDGQAELVQKVGRWEAASRSEICVPLRSLSLSELLRLYQCLINQLPPEHRQTNIIQYQNYIFQTNDFELKLGKQTGKETVFHYELEAKTPSVNLNVIRKELDLPSPLEQSNEAFWTEWNQRVNLSMTEVSEVELTKLITQSLKS